METHPTHVIRLLLVDDHPVVRQGIRSSLRAKKHIRIVGEASNGVEALEQARKLRPDVILLDISMPVMNGLEAAKRLRKIVPKSKILALTMHDKKEYVLRMAQLGARGYVFKDASPSELIEAVETVSASEVFFSPEALRHILKDYVGGGHKSAQFLSSELSDREESVLRLIAEGLTNKEIAEQLCLNHKTVETYRYRLMRKLNLHRVADLTKFAVSRGIVKPC